MKVTNRPITKSTKYTIAKVFCDVVASIYLGNEFTWTLQTDAPKFQKHRRG